MKTKRFFLYFAAIIAGVWLLSDTYNIAQRIINDVGSTSWWIISISLMIFGLCCIIYVPISFLEERRKEKQKEEENDVTITPWAEIDPEDNETSE